METHRSSLHTQNLGMSHRAINDIELTGPCISALSSSSPSHTHTHVVSTELLQRKLINVSVVCYDSLVIVAMEVTPADDCLATMMGSMMGALGCCVVMGLTWTGGRGVHLSTRGSRIRVTCSECSGSKSRIISVALVVPAYACAFSRCSWHERMTWNHTIPHEYDGTSQLGMLSIRGSAHGGCSYTRE